MRAQAIRIRGSGAATPSCTNWPPRWAFGTFRPDEKYMSGLLSPRKSLCRWILPITIFIVCVTAGFASAEASRGLCGHRRFAFDFRLRRTRHWRGVALCTPSRPPAGCYGRVPVTLSSQPHLTTPPSEGAAKVSKGRPQSPLVAAAAAKSPRRGDSPIPENPSMTHAEYCGALAPLPCAAYRPREAQLARRPINARARY